MKNQKKAAISLEQSRKSGVHRWYDLDKEKPGHLPTDKYYFPNGVEIEGARCCCPQCWDARAAIVANPELLASCRAALDILSGGEEKTEAQVREQLRAAIAKATDK